MLTHNIGMLFFNVNSNNRYLIIQIYILLNRMKHETHYCYRYLSVDSQLLFQIAKKMFAGISYLCLNELICMRVSVCLCVWGARTCELSALAKARHGHAVCPTVAGGTSTG